MNKAADLTPVGTGRFDTGFAEPETSEKPSDQEFAEGSTDDPVSENKQIPPVYAYNEGVNVGTIRYVSQLNEVEENGWGQYCWKAGFECTTACISMALSYLGIDASPEALLDFSSKTILVSDFGYAEEGITFSPFSSSYYEEGEAPAAFFEMMRLYSEDKDGIYSPVVLYFSGNGHNHAILVIGQDELTENEETEKGSCFLVTDPTPAGVHRIMVSEDGEITTDEDGYLTRYMPEGGSGKICSLGQWILKSDREVEQE